MEIAVILKVAKQAFVFVVRANPEPELSLRDSPRPGRDGRCQNKHKPAKAAAFLKTQGTVLWIFLPEPVGFAGSGSGVG